ncbi:protein-lysine N-methyltransferase SMYD4 [Pelodytes ibericus]
MEHPIQEWQDSVHQKWLQLSSSEKGTFSPHSDLEEYFMACWSQLQQEEEEILERLCCDLSARKEPRAVLFYKQEGNKRFGRKQYTAAAVLYSKAISHASPGNEEMAICFANRSAVLFHLAHFSACLEDIERAEEHGIPDRLRNKIIQRQAECLQRLKQSVTSNADSPKTESVDPVEPQKENKLDKLEQPKLNSNPQLTNASASLALKCSSSKGRYLVASQDIGQGDSLIWEDAFVSVIIPDRNSLNNKNGWDIGIQHCDLYCHYCLERVTASLPCQYCSFAKYCSHKCMGNAWRSYHHVECSLGGILLALGVFCQTALRAVLVAGIRQVSDLACEIRSTRTKAQELPTTAVPDGKYSSNYQAIVNLLPHTEHHKEELVFLCGLTAAALCKRLDVDKLQGVEGALYVSERPVVEPRQDWSPEIKFLGPAVLRHMLQLHCNAQAVTILQEDYEGPACSPLESLKSSRLATALFPVLSLLNHSCDPNTTVSFRGKCAVVRASRPIKRDEEVTHCYGPHKFQLNVGERQKLLRAQYFFTCQCEACSEELRVKDKITDFLCPKCHSQLKGGEELHCPNTSCAQTVVRKDLLSLRLQHLEPTVNTAREQLQNNNIEVAIRMLKSCLFEAEHFLSPNHILFGDIFDQLAQAEASKGEWKAAAVHLRRSIQLVEHRCGPSSLELGHELFKLAQILFNGCEVADAMSTILRAQQILSMNYGSDHNLVQELQEMRTCLLQLQGIRDSQGR